jgi:hypothetical protein
MAVQHGFGASITDGLIFAYDTIDTTNSYLGEPTTNLVIAPDGNANVVTADVPPGVNVAGYAQYSDGYFVNPRNTTNTAATGRTFTYSVWMRSRTATPSTYLMYVFTGTGPDGGWWYFGDGPLTNQWTKYTYSRNDMTGTVSQVTVYRYNQQGTIEIAAPQIEINSHATQFVNGTRSATQGLLDLTGRSTINISNASFNSNSQMVFDGTNDYGQTGVFLPNITDKTYEAVTRVYDINHQAGGVIGMMGENGEPFDTIVYNETGQGWGFGSTGFQRTAWSGVKETTTGFVHLVATYSNYSYKLYRNGQLILTTTAYPILNYNFNSVIIFGKRHGATTGPYNGEIPVAKIYNRVLSQNEVTQNFKKYQTRFGMS